MTKLFIHHWILTILTHFLEFNTHVMPDFLYVIMYKNGISNNIEKDEFNLLNMKRKIIKRGKDKIICSIWKIEKI